MNFNATDNVCEVHGNLYYYDIAMHENVTNADTVAALQHIGTGVKVFQNNRPIYSDNCFSFFVNRLRTLRNVKK